jgi:hypothetical protein
MVPEKDAASNASPHVCSGVHSSNPRIGPVMIGWKAHLAMRVSPLKGSSTSAGMVSSELVEKDK